MKNTRRYNYEDLLNFTIEVFKNTGCKSTPATVAARYLIRSDLRGIESHGLARLDNYIHLWKEDRIDMQSSVTILHETPSTAALDGNKGMGLLVGKKAMEIAIGKAKNAGTGWVTVKNSNHFGIAANYVLQALDADMIGIAMTNATPTAVPAGAKERMLGTNPICCAFPAEKEAPFLADFATTTVANGKLEVLHRKNKLTPDGWIQNAEGFPSNNPEILKEGGALLPLGGSIETGGYKGFALGSMVDIFTGVLSGASFGPWVPPFPAYLPMPQFMPGEGVGHFFGAMRIDAFQSAYEFKKKMDLWLRTIRNARPIDDTRPVLIPGDIERHFEAEYLQKGIPINIKVEKSLRQLSEEFHISFPSPIHS